MGANEYGFKTAWIKRSDKSISEPWFKGENLTGKSLIEVADIIIEEDVKNCRKIAVQGDKGSFHHMAAMNYFDRKGEILHYVTFEEVSEAVKKGDADVGVLAIENTIAGTFKQTKKIMRDKNLMVIDEYNLPITQNLMVLKGIKIEDIKEVRSHPMTLQQCMTYFRTDKITQNWILTNSEDTALSAKEISENKLRHVATVAGELSAVLYDLEIIKPQINTVKDNFTRFIIIKKAQR